MDELRLAGFQEPLGLWQRRVPPPIGASEVRAYQLEYSSRGDRVPGRLWLPRRSEPEYPLVLLQPDEAEAEPALERIGAEWCERGVAIARVDLPLRGARSDPKLSDPVGTPFAPGPLAIGEALRFELARQAVIDLERALDALCSLDEIDRERIAFVGLGLGALLGAAFCALDPRLRGAVLIAAGAGLAPAPVDPGRYLGRFAPRPLLLVHARQGDVPADAATALAQAAGGSAEQHWLPGRADAQSALPACWPFLARVLRLEAAPG